jgi:manganese/zinc/iron transport system substrate-binding protein
MKRALGKSLAFLCLSLLALAGCTAEPAQETGKIHVLSTTAMIDDIVGQIGRDRIDHTVLISGEIDPHQYELVKGDDEKLARAQLIICNGLGLEHGASLRSWLKKHTQTLFLGDEIYAKSPEKILKVQSVIDPHIWMDISLWQETIDPIVTSLSRLDPAGAEEYRARGDALRLTMEQAHQSILAQMHEIPQEKRFLVSSHDAFNYFARAYLAEPSESVEGWRSRFAAPEGLAPDGQLSVADIQKLIAHVVDHKIGVVFTESNVSRDALKKIAHGCKAKGHPVTLSPHSLYADSMGSSTYLEMIAHNAKILEETWKESTPSSR